MKNKKVRTMGICLSVAVMTSAAGTMPVLAQSATESVQIKVDRSSVITLHAEKPSVETSKVYDGTTDAELLDIGEISGIESGDDVSVEATAQYNDKNAGLGKTITVTYTLTGKDADKYIQPESISISGCEITSKPLSITGAKALDRNYNEQTAVQPDPDALGSLDELEIADGDDVTLDTSNITMTVEDANAGENKPVTVEGYALSGDDSKNYELLMPKYVTVTIHPFQYGASVLEKIKWTQTEFEYTGSEQKPEISTETLPSGVTVEEYTYSDDCINPGTEKTASASLSCDSPNFTLPESSVSTQWSIVPCQPSVEIDYEDETLTVLYPENYQDIPGLQTGISDNAELEQFSDTVSCVLSLNDWNLPVSAESPTVELKAVLRSDQQESFYSDPIAVPSRPTLDSKDAAAQLAGKWTATTDSLTCEDWNSPGIELCLQFADGTVSSWTDTAVFSDLAAGTHVTGVQIRLKAVEGTQFASESETVPVDLYVLQESTISVSHDLGKTYDSAQASVLETDYTYNGDGIVTVSWLDQDKKPLEEAPAEIGTYYVVLSAPQTEQYTAFTTDPIPYTIAKMQAPEILWPAPSEITYGQRLADSALSSEDKNGTFAWKDSSIVPSVSDSNVTEYTIVYQPNDTESYDYSGISLEHTVTVSVQKAESVIDVSNMTRSFTYDGSAQSIASGAVLNHEEAELSYSMDSVTEPGTYTVTISSPETDNYLAAQTDVEITVGKAEAPEIVWPETGEITYGQTLSDSVLSSEDTNGTFTWKEPDCKPSVSDSGTTEYLIVYQPNDTDHYDYTDVDLEHTATVSVQKAESIIDVSGMTHSLTYNGSAQAVNSGAVLNHEEAQLTYSLDSVTEAGTYTVTVSSPETDNYLAADATVEITVEKAASPEIAWPTAGGSTYGQTLADSSLEGGSTEYGTFSWAQSDTRPQAGTSSYEVIFTPSDTENYNWDESEYRSEVTVEVAKKSVSVSAEDKTKTYGDSDPEFTAVTDGLLDGDTLTIQLSRTEGENAGTYAITPQVTENPNYDVTVKDGTLTVSPKQVTSLNMKTSCTVGYDQETQKQTVSIALSDGELSLAQGTDYEFSYVEASEDTEASVTVTGLGNYGGSQTYTNFIVDRFDSLCSFEASVVLDEAANQKVLSIHTFSNRTETGEEMLDEYGNPVYSQRNLSLSREFLDSLAAQSISQIEFQVNEATLLVPLETMTDDLYLVRLAPMEYEDMTWREYVILDEYLELSGSYRFRVTTPINPEEAAEAQSTDETLPEEAAETAEAQQAEPETENDVTAQITGLAVRMAKPEEDKTAEAEGTELAQRKILLVLRGSMEFDDARVELGATDVQDSYQTILPGSGMICLIQDRPENQ